MQIKLGSLVIGLGFLTIAGCQSTGGTERASAASNRDTQVAVNEEGEEIICRREYETGSRVKFTEGCGTAEDWERMNEANREFLKDATGSRAVSNSS